MNLGNLTSGVFSNDNGYGLLVWSSLYPTEHS